MSNNTGPEAYKIFEGIGNFDNEACFMVVPPLPEGFDLSGVVDGENWGSRISIIGKKAVQFLTFPAGCKGHVTDEIIRFVRPSQVLFDDKDLSKSASSETSQPDASASLVVGSAAWERYIADLQLYFEE